MRSSSAIPRDFPRGFHLRDAPVCSKRCPGGVFKGFLDVPWQSSEVTRWYPLRVSLWGLPKKFPGASWRCPERVLRSCLTVPGE